MATSQQGSAQSTVESVERQRQAVLALATINQQARERLRARFVERQAASVSKPNGRKFTMRGLAVEIGTNWEFVKRAHDGEAAFGVSLSGSKLIEYLGLQDAWQPVLAACNQVSLPDAMVSLAMFPKHIIDLVFDIKRTFIVARDEHQAMMADVARVLGMTPAELDSAYYGNNSLLKEIDPGYDQKGERYIALRTKLDYSGLMGDIAHVVEARHAAVEQMRMELNALRDQLLAYKEYASEAAISRKLLGRSGALATIRDKASWSTERYEEYKSKLTAELERLGGKNEDVPKMSPVAAPPSPPPPPVAPPPPPPSVKHVLVEELVDATEGAITESLRLGISALRHQLVFLMGLSDKQSMRFTRIWGVLTDEITDLREHLQALFAETPSAAREKLARLQKERATRSSLGNVFKPKSKK